jgi:hypothetical protein
VPEEDPSAQVNIRRWIDLETADQFVLGWKQLVLMEIDRLRAVMPYADSLEITLTCRRRSDPLNG